MCILWQFSMLCSAWLVNAGRGCKRQPYRRGILQSRSHGCLVISNEYLLLFNPSCCGECFYCAWTEMLWMCVLYANFGSKVRPRTFGCVSMGSAVFLFRGPDCSYIPQGLEWTECTMFCLDLVWDVAMVVCISFMHLCLCVKVICLDLVWDCYVLFR